MRTGRVDKQLPHFKLRVAMLSLQLLSMASLPLCICKASSNMLGWKVLRTVNTVITIAIAVPLDAAVEWLHRQECCDSHKVWICGCRDQWQSSHWTKTPFLLVSEHKLSILDTIVCRSNSTHPGELSLHLLHHPKRLTHCVCLPSRTSQGQKKDAIRHISVPSAYRGVHVIHLP